MSFFYNVHYQYIENVGSLDEQGFPNGGPITLIRHHGHAEIDLPVAIEYRSDVEEIQQFLANSHNMPHFTNFEVLSWQPLLGAQRPA